MKRTLWITAAAAIAQFVFCAFASGQTIADVARRERNRLKQVESRTVTTTGVNAKGLTAATAAGTAGTSASRAPALTTPELKDNQGHDEKYWQAAFQKAREDAKRAEDRVQVLDLQLKDLNNQLLTRSDVYNREGVFGPQITATQKQLEDARKAAVQTRQKIGDLEEELRRAGGPAGWAR